DLSLIDQRIERLFRSLNITRFAMARTQQNDEARIVRAGLIRNLSLPFTFSLALQSRAISARVAALVRSGRTAPVAMNVQVLPLSKRDRLRKKHESYSPARINNSPECSAGSRSALAEPLRQTERASLPNSIPLAPPKSRHSVAVKRQSGPDLCEKSSGS